MPRVRKAMNSTASPADTTMMSSIVIRTLGCSHVTIAKTGAYTAANKIRANPAHFKLEIMFKRALHRHWRMAVFQIRTLPTDSLLGTCQSLGVQQTFPPKIYKHPVGQ